MIFGVKDDSGPALMLNAAPQRRPVPGRRPPPASPWRPCPAPLRLQAAGLEPGIAGNFVQLFVILGISLGWVGSYLFRVATKVGGDTGE